MRTRPNMKSMDRIVCEIFSKGVSLTALSTNRSLGGNKGASRMYAGIKIKLSSTTTTPCLMPFCFGESVVKTCVVRDFECAFLNRKPQAEQN